ncbi:MAG: Zinc transporter ZupT [archaeon GW2011_AR20]|nr:MAG: Zinc transporter ZupT [archaeon GW2011_AR20]MBS3160937.1 ZIP family metal transporter [Candidatus Woesearchaeota archaeon]
MATQLFNTLFYSSVAGIATILGILIVLFAKEFTRKYSIYLVSFAAGVLVTFALIHLIPESLKLYQHSLWFVLAGFLIFYLIEHLVMHHPFHEPTGREHAAGKTAVLGLGFHSLIDGVVIGAGFEISNEIGLIATFAVIAHELPEGLTAMAVLMHAKFKKIKSLIYSFLVAIATPVGAILTYYFIKSISEGFLGFLLALAAGSFLYVGASDLVPETHEQYKGMNAVYFVIGILFVVIISFIFS